jgi:hypothetical protein
MIARVYFRDGQITAICTGQIALHSDDESREFTVFRDVSFSDFEMLDGVPSLRPVDSPPRRFGFTPPQE